MHSAHLCRSRVSFWLLKFSRGRLEVTVTADFRAKQDELIFCPCCLSLSTGSFAMFYRHFVGQQLKMIYIYIRASFKILRLFCPNLASHSYTYWYVRQVTVTAHNNCRYEGVECSLFFTAYCSHNHWKYTLHSLLHPQSLTIYSPFVIAATIIQVYSPFVIAATITHNLFFTPYCSHNHWQSILLS